MIGENNPVFVIAEAGVNHNGSVAMAKKMVDSAKAAGADAIKFQSFRADQLVTYDAPKALYQQARSLGKNQYEMLKQLELSEAGQRELFDHCRKRGILFLSTPFDGQSAEFLNRLGMPAFKISSGDLTDLPLLLKIARMGKPMILSTGMATLQEIDLAVKTVKKAGNKKLILLHCTSNYPTEYLNVNLKAMQSMGKKFDLPVGLSDHTLGIEVPIAAVALGACVIEKHFTLDISLPGPDQLASLEPEELKQMVSAIRNVEMALGDGEKAPRKSEKQIALVARKSIVAAAVLIKGTRISPDMLAVKRPGTGIEPKYLNKFIGKTVKKNILKDQLIDWNMFK